MVMAGSFRAGDAGFQIVTLLEVQIDEVIASHGPVQRQRNAGHIYPLDIGRTPRCGPQITGDFLKVIQFAGGVHSPVFSGLPGSRTVQPILHDRLSVPLLSNALLASSHPLRSTHDIYGEKPWNSQPSPAADREMVEVLILMLSLFTLGERKDISSNKEP